MLIWLLCKQYNVIPSKFKNCSGENSRKMRNIPTDCFFFYTTLWSICIYRWHFALMVVCSYILWKFLDFLFKFAGVVSSPINMKILHLKISRWIWQILTSVPTPTITTFQTLANSVKDLTSSITPQCRITLDHATILEISHLLFLHQQVN